jgi:hypothetical protein
MVSKKVGNCDKWMDDKHTYYPPSFCFIGNPFIYGYINNHPYFKGENQYSSHNNNWQPYTQVQYMVSIHTYIVIAARTAGPAPGRGGEQVSGCVAVGVARPQQAVQRLPGRALTVIHRS